MIQDINFLPVKYRQMRRCRQQKLWRRSIVIVFLALVGAGVVGQRQACSRLIQTRNKMRADADRLTSQLDDPQKLRDEAARLDGQANVLAFLRIRVPPTRVLSAVTNTLPKYVTLTELDMKFEPLPAAPAGSAPPAAPPATAAAPAADPTPPRKDLADLQKEREQNALFVTVSGIAPDDIAIAGYLASLQKTRVFADVVLQYTDQHVIDEANLRRFGIRLKVNTPNWQELPREGAASTDPARGHANPLGSAGISPSPSIQPAASRQGFRQRSRS